MSYRVEELAARADVPVDTVRYYQTRDLLPPPTRSGRVALYSDAHLERLAEIRRLQGRGYSLAVIRRLLDGELNHADEALVAAVSAEAGGAGADDAEVWLTIEALAERSGIPLPLLQAVEREGLLIPRLHAGQPRYTPADEAAAAAGLRLLQHGLPLPELLDLARSHSAAMRATAERAVELFDVYVRRALRRPDGAGVRERRPRAVRQGRSTPTATPPGASSPPSRSSSRPPSPSSPITSAAPCSPSPRNTSSGSAPTGSSRSWRPAPSDPSNRPSGARDGSPGHHRPARGRRQGPGRPGDVRHHRPPLRPGQPVDDLRDGSGLAAPGRAVPGPRPGGHGRRPGLRHRGPVPGAADRRVPLGRHRPVPRHARPRPHHRPAACRATPCTSPCRPARWTAP